MKLTPEEIYLSVREILTRLLKISENEVQKGSILSDDLGIDSVESLDLVFALEDKFKIKVTEKEMAEPRSVNDIINLVQSKIAKN